jgi:hypothetical protein
MGWIREEMFGGRNKHLIFPFLLFSKSVEGLSGAFSTSGTKWF